MTPAKHHVAILIILTAVPVGADAQTLPQPPPKLQSQLNAIRSAPPSQWLERTAGVAIPYLQNQIWDKAQEIAGQKLAKPTIQIRMDAAEPAPFTESGNIVFPALFLAPAYLSAYLMSHDLYVDDGYTFPVPDSILQRPYAVSPIQRLLPLTGFSFESPATVALTTMLACYGRDERCDYFQTITIASVLAFALGHEYGHIVAGDAGHREYTFAIEKEKAADSWSLKLLLAFAPEFANDATRRDYFLLGWPALLRLKMAMADSEKGGQSRTELQERLTALLAQLPTPTKERYESLMQTDDTDGMSSLKMEWTDRPEWIAIDGVLFRPEQLQGKNWRLPSGLHHIASLAAGKFAYTEKGTWNSDEVVRLDFQPFASATPDLLQLDALKANRSWGEILLRTSTPDLKPRSATVAVRMYEALRFAHLGQFISPETLPISASASDRTKVVRWAKSAHPLTNWAP